MKNTKLLYIVFGFIFVVFSALFFIFIEIKDAVFWISYIFSLISIAGVFSSSVALIKGKSKNYIQEFSFMPIAVVYLFVQVTVTAFLGYAIGLALKWYILIHIIALAIAIVLIMFLIMARNSNIRAIEKTQEKVIEVKSLVSQLQLMKQKSEWLESGKKNEFVSILDRLIDMIKYSDPMYNDSLKPIQDDIVVHINQLDNCVDLMNEQSSDSIEDIKMIAKKIESLVLERNTKVKLLK